MTGVKGVSVVECPGVHAQAEPLLSQFWQQVQVDYPHHCDALRRRHSDIAQGFGLSQFIATKSLSHPQWLIDAVLPDQAIGVESFSDGDDEIAFFRQLRRYRHFHMFQIAWQDLVEGQGIQASLQKVSELTDRLIQLAYQWSYKQLANRYGAPSGKDGTLPLLVLGMGKLGGKELNFSSDIDLIFTYPHQGELHYGRKSIEYQQFFTKVGQKLIAALDQITAEGRVHRVDMRLRPLGESGPLVIHFDALEDYYQEQGREWERYALVKARVINPEPVFTPQLQRILRPFVYRRYLDFSAIESLREMKQKIAQEYRRRDLDDNIKLGRGGIREIEFVAQCLQLIHGGKQRELRTNGLLDSLHRLEQNGLLSPALFEQLHGGYLFLRKVEHCLQQFNDEQTQTLPDDAVSQQRLAMAMGCDGYVSFAHSLNRVQGQIHEVFQHFIGDEDDGNAEVDDRCQQIWAEGLAIDELEDLLSQLLPEHKDAALASTLASFRQQMLTKVRGERGARVLAKLVPLLLQQMLVDEVQLLARNGILPSQLLTRVGWVLSSVLGRTAYLELLQSNVGALKQLLKLCAQSHWIAEQLSHFPLLLDDLLNPVTLYQPTAASEYLPELQRSLLRIPEEDEEQQWTQLRQFKLSQQLHVAAADVSGALPVMHVSDHLTFLAESLLQVAVNLARQQLAVRFGHLPSDPRGNRFGIIAYGKLGGIELGYGSDLDLVFVYQTDRQEQTTGPKNLDAGQYFLKLAQRVLHILTTKTALGPLYDVDMRLRPSGSAGLLVCHIDAYQHYLGHDAWNWEFQALVRARMVFGDDALKTAFQAIRAAGLRQSRDPEQLRHSVASMREKMRQHKLSVKGDEFDIKQSSGGMTDIEFLIQYWILLNAVDCPELCQWTDNVRQLEGLVAQGYIDKSLGDQLTQSYLAFRGEYHHQVLQCNSGVLSQHHVSDEIAGHRRIVTEAWAKVFSNRSCD